LKFPIVETVNNSIESSNIQLKAGVGAEGEGGLHLLSKLAVDVCHIHSCICVKYKPLTPDFMLIMLLLTDMHFVIWSF
jgi:hypothetical protein